MYTPPAHVRRLLCQAERVIEKDEIVIRAIFDSQSASGNPLALKMNKKTLHKFFPSIDPETRTYDGTLSIIHEAGRTPDDIIAQARQLNTTTLALLMRITIAELAQLNEQEEEGYKPSVNVYRDNVDYDGHSVLCHYPDDDKLINIMAMMVRNAFVKANKLIVPM